MVVGAGPTGMLLAAELSRRNIAVRLLEKKDRPAEHSRALGVVPRTMEMFEQLGLIDELLTHGHRVHGIRIYGKERRLLVDLDLRKLPTRYPFMLLLPQTQTEAILRHFLKEVEVKIEWGSELTAFRPEKTGVGVEFTQDGQTQEAFCGYLAGCDGAHSTVRKKAGLEFPGAAYQQNWLLADVSLEPRLDPKFMHLFTCPSGPMIFFPLPENVWRIVAMRPGTALDAGQATLEEIAQLLEQNRLGHLRPHRLLWVAGFAIHHRRTDRLRQGRVFLCGDAAHIHSPAGGQGMNTGLGDAFNLGWKLAAVARGHGTEALLDSYEKERLPVIDGVLKLTDQMTRMMTATTGPKVWMREWFMPWASRLGMTKKMGERLSQLQVGYPQGPAVLPDARRKPGMIPVGNRVPPMAMKNQKAGRNTYLTDLLFRGRPAMILFPEGQTRTEKMRREVAQAGQVDWHWILREGQTSEEIREGDGVWMDGDGMVRSALGDPDHASWALLRPDGILMARGEICETSLLAEFLNRLFGGSGEGSEMSGP